VKFDKYMENRRNKKAEESRRALARSQSSQSDPMNMEMLGMNGGRPMLGGGGLLTRGRGLQDRLMMERRGLQDRLMTTRRGLQDRLVVGRGLQIGGVTLGAGPAGLLPKETKLETMVANADLAEHWATEKVLWIVVMSADKDNEIVDIDIAEGLADEENIDEEAWQAEMALEREEDEYEYRIEEERRAEVYNNGSLPEPIQDQPPAYR